MGSARRRWWYGLFLLPYAALLWVPIYARTDPKLFSIPFFYWYQFAWVIGTALVTTVVYRATTRR